MITLQITVFLILLILIAIIIFKAKLDGFNCNHYIRTCIEAENIQII